MSTIYGFYPIDDMNEDDVERLHGHYLDRRFELNNLSHLLYESEVRQIKKECQEYEYALSVLLPESVKWTDAEWEDTNNVVKKLHETYGDFLDKNTSIEPFVDEDSKCYYELVMKVLNGYSLCGDDAVMRFLSEEKEEELALFIARFLQPDRYEEYLIDIFMKICARIIAFERNEDDDFYTARLADVDFKGSWLYQYVSGLVQGDAYSDSEVKQILFTLNLLH